ncbi:hypothetical protein K437DRAFT_257194 [Tilletiaria anomala UBC 951]|uniref:Uncharacterized protein n=1 Tax=Tilletiaria anomala (strain ATCC 24038 / CBS 436.72 / UBC 951) TaxID=1037660 RepID=A0A066VZU2_TILAU|nr:uncharacterized protein K437DRAFT_257194 [Tilletiaria anomala UBC 951]KDN44060.1 hypothetical protein K437DRAFT_257194 [Tilletiaria anomala UBC 951]
MDEDLFMLLKGQRDKKTTLAVLEAGHQKGNGPPGFGILNNEETTLELPYVRLRPGSKQPYIYKSQIFTDSPVAGLFGGLVFGLHETQAKMVPPNSSDALNYDQDTVGWFKIERVAMQPQDTSGVDWKDISNQPWFTDGPLCGRHVYNVAPTISLRGDVQLLPSVLKEPNPAAEPLAFFDVEGIRMNAHFKIIGPASCAAFDTAA